VSRRREVGSADPENGGDIMGRRIIILMGAVVAAVLLIVGVAAAAGGPAPSDDVSLSTASSYAPDTETTVDPTTDTTVITTETTADTNDTEVTEVDGDDTGDGNGDTTHTSSTHPDNFGGTISSLRHAGDHTPGAVIKGHKVPGWSKKHPEGTTTTTTAPPQ
jgi:hypothetical protein